MQGVMVSSLRAANPPSEKDWRQLAGPVRVRRTRVMECDAASPGSIRAVTDAVRSELAHYMRSQFPTRRKAPSR
jgi:hypothetical protein